MTKTISVSVLQSWLAGKSPDEEINMNTLATTMQDDNLQKAVTFFAGLPETTKVQYIIYLYNYYYNIIVGLSCAWVIEPSTDDSFLQQVEDEFIIKFNLNTTELVPLRRLLGRLQKETCKQRIYKKEDDVVNPMSGDFGD